MTIDLTQLFWRGLIVGPQESHEAFLKRVSHLQSAPILVYKQMQVDWVPVIYSNNNLRLWEGGCSWIEDDKVTIQLKSKLKDKPALFGIYCKQEMLLHELLHAIRLKFDEPIFEEIVAYRTSKSSFRRYWGGLFRSPRETLLSVIVIVLFTLAPLIFFPLFLLGAAFLWWRLSVAHRILKKTYKKLKLLAIDPDLCLLGLTDKEIKYFSQKSGDEILDYIAKQTCLRWKQLKAVFFESSLSCRSEL